MELGLVGHGNRKDLRNAVEAATSARGWAKSTAHLRAQILYYLGENLAVRSEEFAKRIVSMTGEDLASPPGRSSFPSIGSSPMRLGR